jgi:hypothetical protein
MAFFRQFPKTTYDFDQNGIDTTIIDLFRFIKIDETFFDDLATYEYYDIKDGDRPDIVSNSLYGTPEYYWTFFLCNDNLKNGLSGWPMTGTQFEDYMNLEYNGTVIQTRPRYIITGDDLIAQVDNSLADRFNLIDRFDVPSHSYFEGETIVGMTSEATGILKEKNVQMCQLVLRDVTGNFLADTSNPNQLISENIRGTVSGDIVSTYRVYSHRDAPHHYEDANGLISYNALNIDESKTIQNGGSGVQPGTTDGDLTAVSNFQYETRLNEERSKIRVVRPKAIYQFAQAYKNLLNG